MDGPGGFVPDLPLTLRQNLGEDSVPLLAGICKDDGSLYTTFCKLYCIQLYNSAISLQLYSNNAIRVGPTCEDVTQRLIDLP